MRPPLSFPLIVVLAAAFVACPDARAQNASLDELLAEIRRYAGVELVFTREELPPGTYYDILRPLTESQRLATARICLRDLKKYPPRYLGNSGLKAVGVFAACVSKSTDGYRQFDSDLGGYSYYGIYNRKNAVAVAHYDDGQLRQTLHHEIFHHVDSTEFGQTGRWVLDADDAFFRAAIGGAKPYRAPRLDRKDVFRLREIAAGDVLQDAVSGYAKKNVHEDQAETARYMMANLPDAILQTIDQPELPGSQRILHALTQYQRATDDGPGIEWFVDVALGRAPEPDDDQLRNILRKIRGYALRGRSGFDGVENDPDGARNLLKTISRLDVTAIPAQRRSEIVRLSARATQALMKHRLRPNTNYDAFTIWGQEDAQGINWTLRGDLQVIARDAARLKQIARFDHRQSDSVAFAQLSRLRLLARYYTYIANQWTITQGTENEFRSAHYTLCSSLPQTHADLGRKLRGESLLRLGQRIPLSGKLDRCIFLD